MTTQSMVDSWVLRPKPHPQARLRLFCFPYAGGGASTFLTWADNLPKEIEVCPVQLPGREERLAEEPFTQLMPLVQTLAQALRPYMSIPFAFFGHSMGSLIIFELTRQLRRSHLPGPVHLVVSGRHAPHLPNRYPSIHQLPQAKFVAKLRRLGGTPEAILQNSKLLQIFLPILRVDFALVEGHVYVTERPIECSISAFGGEQDERVTYEEMTAWRQHTVSNFTLRLFPGDHFYLRSAQGPLLRTLSQDLVQALNRTIKSRVFTSKEPRSPYVPRASPRTYP